MKQLSTLLCTGIALCITTLTHTKECVPADTPTTKCYTRRSDGRHKYLQMVGATDKTHIDSDRSFYSTLQANVGYRASFDSCEIATCLFGGHFTNDDCCGDRAIKVQGTAIEKRDPDAWLADYFYLPRNYDGSFSVDPQIKTFFADLGIYVGLDALLCGLYFRLHGPVACSRWHLNFCDNPSLDGATALNHPNGYFSPGVYEGNLLVQSFADYAKGGTPQTSTNVDNLGTNANLPGVDQGIQNSTLIFQPLKYAKMATCKRKEHGFADLRAELGWDFWQAECYHLGVNVQFAAPTGKKKEPCFLFDAMLGNGNHWEVGGGLTGHYNFWASEDGERSFSVHLDANLSHLFTKCMKRTFDLRNKPNSAYMLATKHGGNGPEDPPDDQITVGIETNPPVATQFAGEYAPVANLSTVKVDVSVRIQADIALLFAYRCGNFTWDIGYDFWGHSCEKIECPQSCTKNTSICDASQRDTWTLKGDARMFGFITTNGANTIEGIPLSVSQNAATILSGTNNITPFAAFGALNTADNNPNVDNPVEAWKRDPGGAQMSNIPGAADNAINLSKDPIFLKCSDIDFTRTQGLSHTVFTNISYSFDRKCWSPYVGVGLSAEFATRGCNDDNDISFGTTSVGNTFACSPCINCAVSQWSVWVMGGLHFS